MCVDESVPAPVGQHCSDCVRAARPPSAGAPRVTRALAVLLVAVHVLTFLGRDRLVLGLGLVPVAVGAGDWWRLLTSALLHGGLLHLAFNVMLLVRLGEALELRLGHARFTSLVAAGAAGGGLGVVVMAWVTATTPLVRIPLLGTLLATSPSSVTIGASGAVFGLMGATMAVYRAAGLDPWRTDVGGLVALNLILTFAVPMISVGGHLGGLAAGWLAGRTLLPARGGPAGRRRAAGTVAVAAAGLVVVAAWLARLTLAAVVGG